MDWLFEKLWLLFTAIVSPVLIFFWDAIVEFGAYFWNTIQTYISLVYDWTIVQGNLLVAEMFDLIPEDMVPSFVTASQYWGMANYFLPLSETLVILGSLVFFWTTFIVFKYTWKLIPFTG